MTKNLWIATLVLIVALFSCKKEDPHVPHEEEVITTLEYKLTPTNGGNSITFLFSDPDGDGGNAPTITTSALAVNTTYNGEIVLKNETETPAEDMTPEVKKEGTAHQFFFAGTNVSVSTTDEDSKGNPLGLKSTLTTSNAGASKLKITLKHEPKKPNNGTLSDAGGETDIEVEFTFDVQ